MASRNRHFRLPKIRSERKHNMLQSLRKNVKRNFILLNRVIEEILLHFASYAKQTLVLQL